MQVSHTKGFSLIELLISMTIFSVVVTISTGTLLILIDANSKAQNMQSVLDNLTLALDSMTREIRTGQSYRCRTSAGDGVGFDNDDATNDCTSGGNYVSVVESGGSLTAGLSGARISYRFDPDHYGSSPDHGAIVRRLGGSGDSGAWLPITSRNVKINNMEFIVSGTDNSAGDTAQPSVTIFIEGESGALSNVDTTFAIQTTVVQRVIDL